jgi:phosphate transport system permease protein
MSPSSGDRILRWGLGISAVVCGSVVLLMVGFLLSGALPALQTGMAPRFFLDSHWRPSSLRDPQYALLPMLAASLLVTTLATVLACPIAIAAAIFNHFFLPSRWAAIHRRILELLAGIPSVVFGFWGLTVLVPLINRVHPPGPSLLAAGLVLALMILPTITLTSHAAMRAVPHTQLMAAAGLGLGRLTTIRTIVLPAARHGIVAGIGLAVARAVGETMAVVMVCGNVAQIPSSLFDPVRPVTATIALEMGYATASHKSLLYAAGFILVLVTATLTGWFTIRKPSAQASPR